MLGALRALKASRRTVALIALIGWLGVPFLHDLVHWHEEQEEAEAELHGGHAAHHEHAEDHDDPAEHGRDSAEHGDVALVRTAPPLLPPAPLEYTFTALRVVSVPWCSEGVPFRLVARPPPSSVA